MPGRSVNSGSSTDASFGGASGRLTATLTKSSTDDGYGRRLAGVAVLAAEGVAGGVDGLALEAEVVEAEGDASGPIEGDS